MIEPGSILLVDDEEANLELARDLLGDTFTVKSATSGEQALAVMSGFTPDIVLLDVSMKGLDGYEICHRIRTIPQFDCVKIVMLSAKGQLADKMIGYEAGCDDYVTKPFRPEELMAKVRAYMRHVRGERALQLLNTKLSEQIRSRTEHLQRAERLAFVGQHVAAVLHDLQNPLTVLRGMSRIGQKEQPDNKRFDAIEKGVERMENIVTGILANSSPDLKDPGLAVHLNAVLASELKFLTLDHFLKYNVDVTQEFADDLPPCRATESALRQIFGNVVKNAIEAMATCEVRNLRIKTSGDSRELVFVVEDTGKGIPLEHLPRLFDPFFTTKAASPDVGTPRGAGLGLAGAKQTLEAYKGRIEVRSEVGRGTTVTVRLPVAQAADKVAA